MSIGLKKLDKILLSLFLAQVNIVVHGPLGFFFYWNIIKIYIIAQFKPTQYIYVFFPKQKEVILCRQLNHENIVKFHCTFVHENTLWTVMPLLGYGEL